MPKMITRFAPSPTGKLHLGHAASAWHVWTTAKAHGGAVLLRIEDIDTTRCRPEYTAAIYQDLAWLGFSWPDPVRIQSQHFSEYALAVDALARRGLAYRCFRTRRDLQNYTHPFSGGPLQPAEENQKLADGAPFAWRLSLTAARDVLGPIWTEMTYNLLDQGTLRTLPVQPDLEGDIVLARKDSPSAYHLAATHDDALQGITHIIRGDDLAEAVHVQTLLQTLMNWPHPTYLNHPLIFDADGQKLSKRARSPSLAAQRISGITPEQLWGQLGLDQ